MKRNILYIIMCLLMVASASARSGFRTAELERLAHELALDVNVLPEGYSHPTVNGFKLTVHQTEQTVDHIGLYLFTDELRQIGKSPVFDFLERYFLQLHYPPAKVKTMSAMLSDDKFRFLSGSMATIDQIQATDRFSFTYDNHTYQASWRRNDSTLLAVSFPVEYELISGENKIEAEDNLISDIKATKFCVPDIQPVMKKGHYILENLTNRLYIQDGGLISDTRHPAESVANMMLSLQAEGQYMMAITQMSYGFRKVVSEVPLKQWIAFCETHACELYFGIEKMTEDGDIDCVVIAVNEAENYNHVLTAHIPVAAIGSKEGTLEARLYPYIPTHNVLNMFAAYRKSNPKTFVSE